MAAPGNPVIEPDFGGVQPFFPLDAAGVSMPFPPPGGYPNLNAAGTVLTQTGVPNPAKTLIYDVAISITALQYVDPRYIAQIFGGGGIFGAPVGVVGTPGFMAGVIANIYTALIDTDLIFFKNIDYCLMAQLNGYFSHIAGSLIVPLNRFIVFYYNATQLDGTVLLTPIGKISFDDYCGIKQRHCKPYLSAARGVVKGGLVRRITVQPDPDFQLFLQTVQQKKIVYKFTEASRDEINHRRCRLVLFATRKNTLSEFFFDLATDFFSENNVLTSGTILTYANTGCWVVTLYTLGLISNDMYIYFLNGFYNVLTNITTAAGINWGTGNSGMYYSMNLIICMYYLVMHKKQIPHLKVYNFNYDGTSHDGTPGYNPGTPNPYPITPPGTPINSTSNNSLNAMIIELYQLLQETLVDLPVDFFTNDTRRELINPLIIPIRYTPPAGAHCSYAHSFQLVIDRDLTFYIMDNYENRRTMTVAGGTGGTVGTLKYRDYLDQRLRPGKPTTVPPCTGWAAPFTNTPAIPIPHTGDPQNCMLTHLLFPFCADGFRTILNFQDHLCDVGGKFQIFVQVIPSVISATTGRELYYSPYLYELIKERIRVGEIARERERFIGQLQAEAEEYLKEMRMAELRDTLLTGIKKAKYACIIQKFNKTKFNEYLKQKIVTQWRKMGKLPTTRKTGVEKAKNKLLEMLHNIRKKTEEIKEKEKDTLNEQKAEIILDIERRERQINRQLIRQLSRQTFAETPINYVSETDALFLSSNVANLNRNPEAPGTAPVEIAPGEITTDGIIPGTENNEIIPISNMDATFTVYDSSTPENEEQFRNSVQETKVTMSDEFMRRRADSEVHNVDSITRFTQWLTTNYQRTVRFIKQYVEILPEVCSGDLSLDDAREIPDAARGGKSTRRRRKTHNKRKSIKKRHSHKKRKHNKRRTRR
jgi:hypothetical protein